MTKNKIRTGLQKRLRTNQKEKNSDSLIALFLQPDVVNVFQIVVSSNSLSLKYQRLPDSGCKDIAIRKFEFVTRSQLVLSFF